MKLFRKIISFLEKRDYLATRRELGSIGIKCVMNTNSRNITVPKNIHMDDYSSVGRDVIMYATPNSSIILKKGAIVAPRCKLITSNHNYDNETLLSVPFDNRNIVKDIVIGEGAWLADSVIILSGVTIGRGAIVGTGSVVTKDVPDYAIVAGNPARILKYRNKDRFEELYSKNKFYHSVDWTNYGGKQFIR